MGLFSPCGICGSRKCKGHSYRRPGRFELTKKDKSVNLPRKLEKHIDVKCGRTFCKWCGDLASKSHLAEQHGIYEGDGD